MCGLWGDHTRFFYRDGMDGGKLHATWLLVFISIYITRRTVSLNTLTVCLQASSVDLLVEFSAASAPSLAQVWLGCGATGTWVNLGEPGWRTAGGARSPSRASFASSPRTYEVVPAAAAPSHPCRGARLTRTACTR